MSPDRVATYLQVSGKDPSQALQLYTRNTALSAAFYGPLQGLEIAVRNALYRKLTIKFGTNWFDVAETGLNARALDQIDRAKRELIRDHQPPDPPHLVAALSFGFWVVLLGKGGASNYEMSLWRPVLAKALPYDKASRESKLTVNWITFAHSETELPTMNRFSLVI